MSHGETGSEMFEQAATGLFHGGRPAAAGSRALVPPYARGRKECLCCNSCLRGQQRGLVHGGGETPRKCIVRWQEEAS